MLNNERRRRKFKKMRETILSLFSLRFFVNIETFIIKMLIHYIFNIYVLFIIYYI